MQRKLIIVASFLLIIVVSIALMKVFENNGQEMAKTPDKENIKYVKAVPFNPGDIEAVVSGSGRLTSQSLVDLSSEVQGKILTGNIDLKKGQSFKKGELLIKIYDEEFSLSIQASKSRFLTSIANILPDIKVDFKENYNSWSDFFDSIKMNSTLPELPEVKSKQEKIFLASRNILSDYYSIKSNELRLKKYNIYAPFSGVFTNVYNEVGSVANPGAKLAQIIRTDMLELEIPVDVNDIKWLKLGDKAKVTNEEGSLTWTGRIERIAKYVDPTTQSISVFVKIDTDSSQPLYNGQYLKAEFNAMIIHDAFEIPRNAVFNYDEVYVVSEKILQKRVINIKKINKNSIIFTGLEKGIEIVVEPLINVVENTPVEILR